MLQRLTPLYEEALKNGLAVESESKRPVIQRFVNNKERFFRPLAVSGREEARRR